MSGAASRLAASMQLDVRLQSRSHLYTMGVGTAVMLGLMVRYLVPVEHVGRGLVAFYVLGLGGTTFMFGASMLLLEKGERTLDALRVTPARAREYLLSKAVTLTAFAMVESAIVYAIAARGVPTNPWPLIGGALVLGVFYTLVGLGLAAPFDAITRFLLPTGTLVAMILQLPFLSLVGLGPDWLWYAVPTQAPLLILLAAFEPLSTGQWLYALGMSTAMIGGAYALCVHRFRHALGFSG